MGTKKECHFDHGLEKWLLEGFQSCAKQSDVKGEAYEEQCNDWDHGSCPSKECAYALNSALTPDQMLTLGKCMAAKKDCHFGRRLAKKSPESFQSCAKQSAVTGEAYADQCNSWKNGSCPSKECAYALHSALSPDQMKTVGKCMGAKEECHFGRRLLANQFQGCAKSAGVIGEAYADQCNDWKNGSCPSKKCAYALKSALAPKQMSTVAKCMGASKDC